MKTLMPMIILCLFEFVGGQVIAQAANENTSAVRVGPPASEMELGGDAAVDAFGGLVYEVKAAYSGNDLTQRTYMIVDVDCRSHRQTVQNPNGPWDYDLWTCNAVDTNAPAGNRKIVVDENNGALTLVYTLVNAGKQIQGSPFNNFISGKSILCTGRIQHGNCPPVNGDSFPSFPSECTEDAKCTVDF